MLYKHLVKQKAYILIFMFLLAFSVAEASIFRSAGSGPWNSNTSWQIQKGGSWNTPKNGEFPTNKDDATIRNGHTITVGVSSSVDDLVIESGGVLTLNATLEADNSLTNNSGGTINLNSQTLLISRAAWAVVFTNNGTLNAGTGTIHFSASGQGQQFIGSATFYNVLVTNSKPDLGANATINGTLTLTGGSAEIRSNAPTYGPNSTLVYDQSFTINGGDLAWPTGSSNVPTNIEVQSGTLAINADRTIKGSFSLNGGSMSQPTYTTITFAGTSPSISGGPVFTNVAIASGANFSATGNAYFNSVDIQSGATFTSTSDTLFLSGGNITELLRVNGTFNANGGTVYLSRGYNNEISGSPTLNNVIVANGPANFSGTATVNGTFTIVGNQTVTAAPNYGSDATLRLELSGTLTLNGGSLVWPSGTGSTVPPNVDIQSGTLALNGHSVTLIKNLNVETGATFNALSGSFSYGGAEASITGGGTVLIGAIVVSNGSTFNITSTTSVTSLTIDAGGICNCNTDTLILTGLSGTANLTNNGTLNCSNGTVVLAGSSSNVTTGTMSVGNFVIRNSPVEFSATTTVTGQLTLEDQQINAAPQYGASAELRIEEAVTLSLYGGNKTWPAGSGNDVPPNVTVVSGTLFIGTTVVLKGTLNVESGATFDGLAGSLSFSGASASITGTGTALFGDVTIGSGSTFTLATTTTFQNLTIDAGGTCNCGTDTLVLNDGDATLTNNGTFNCNNGVVYFDGDYGCTTNGTINFNDVIVNNPGADFNTGATVNGTLTMINNKLTTSPVYGASAILRFDITGSLILYGGDATWESGVGSKVPPNVEIVSGTLDVRKSISLKGILNVSTGATFDARNGSANVTFVGNTQLQGSGTALFGAVTVGNGANFTTGTFSSYTSLTIDAGGVFTVSGNDTLLITGNNQCFTNNGTFNAGTGTVKINTTTGCTIGGTVSFYNIVVDGDSVNFGTGSTVLNSFKVQNDAFVARNNPAYSTNARLIINQSMDIDNSSLTWVSGSPGSTLPRIIEIESGTVNITSVKSVPNQLILTGGTLTGGTNINIASGVTITRTNGLLSAAPTFAGTVNVVYNDATGQITSGAEIPAAVGVLQKLTSNNSNGVLLDASVTINDSLLLNSGALTIGANTLTINDYVGNNGGTISGSSSSNIILAGSESGNVGTLTFTTGSRTLNNFTLNRTGSNTSVTLGSDVDVQGTLLLTYGDFIIDNNTLTLSGNINFNGGALNANGSSNLTISGSGTITGNFIVDETNNTFNNFTVSRTTDITLGSELGIDGTLSMSQTNFIIGNHNLIIGPSGSFSGTFSASNMIVTDGMGIVRKEMNSTGSLTIPVGDNIGTAEYTPITVNFTSGTFNAGAYYEVSAVDSTQQQCQPSTNYLTRFWRASATNIDNYSVTIAASYVDADIVGNENKILNKIIGLNGCESNGVVNKQSNIVDIVTSALSIITGGSVELAPEPTIQVSSISFSNKGANSLTLTFNDGNGTNYLVVASTSSSFIGLPEDGITYTASDYGLGTEISTGEYVVYNGLDATTTISGLPQNSTIYFQVFAFNSSGLETENYLLTSPATNSTYTYLTLSLSAILEGPYNGTEMTTNLNSLGLLPTNQPYDTIYSYNGTEAVTSIPSADIVDWVYVELRNGVSPENATSANIIAQRAAFLLKDGSVVDTNLNSQILFETSLPDSFYVVVYHHNHLPIMSNFYIDQDSDHYRYDMTSSPTDIYNSSDVTSVNLNDFAAKSGYVSGGTVIDQNDLNKAWSNRNKSGYLTSDTNLDGKVDSEDRSDVWNKQGDDVSIP